MNMQKRDLADFILQYLYESDDVYSGNDYDDGFYGHFQGKSIDELTIEVNNRFGVDPEQVIAREEVVAAVQFLHSRDLVKEIECITRMDSQYDIIAGLSLNCMSTTLNYVLSNKGEDLVSLGYKVEDFTRKNIGGQVNNTTVQGNIEQFVQGDHNSVVQHKAGTPNELLEDILRLLENHNETAVVKETREAKQEGGIHAALKYLADKAFGGGFTYAGTAITQQVISMFPQITQALN